MQQMKIDAKLWITYINVSDSDGWCLSMENNAFVNLIFYIIRIPHEVFNIISCGKKTACITDQSETTPYFFIA